MNIQELIAYSDQPVLQPLLLEVGTLMLKVIYGKIDETDLDKAKGLVHNAGIEADWLTMLAEGNPAYMDDVINAVYTDICIGDTALVMPINEVLLGHDRNNMPVYISKDFDQEEIDYLATEFGVEYNDEGDLE